LRSQAVRPATVIGIALALAGPGLIALGAARLAGSSDSLAAHAVFLLLFLALVGTVAAIAWRGERLSAPQLGIRGLSWATPLRAALLTLFFVFVFGPLAVTVLAKLHLGSLDAGRAQLSGLPSWYVTLAVVIVAAGEEWLYRGYALERLEAVLGSTWAAASISLVAFVLAHFPLWGWAIALTTLVSGGILTALYVRYRDIMFLMLAHVLTDLYGLVLAPSHH
jgi:membrane protease YdiL (CAAX protease family)